MLTSKQIKSLPKGDYPNWRLMELFKNQGEGRSAKFVLKKDEEAIKRGEKRPNFIRQLINQFTGQVVKQKVRKTQNK